MAKKNGSLLEIASVFFKMGCFAFGGPAAHIAMMDQEIIQKRKWMTRQHFLDLIGATNLIPGPNSTEMTMHCGHERGGVLGLFIAGISFIFPAVLITGVLAYLYVEYGSIPDVENFIIGIKPAVIAVIAGAVFKLGKKALKSLELGILGAIVVVVSMLPNTNEVLVLLGAGIIGAFYFYTKNKDEKSKVNLMPLALLKVPTVLGTNVLSTTVFWKFLKVGCILYGSGYVLFAYLDAELVQTGLLSRKELLDAIAVGQFTPGPVLSTATFIGYQLAGLWGAIAATIGIFLPSFLFVLLLNPLIPKMRESKFLSGFLDSVNIAAVGIMLAVLFNMGQESIFDWRTSLIAVASLFFTFGPKKVSAMWIIAGGAGLGYLLFLI
ncbi:chromate efflux transporter [Crocinitomicaceae bacterium]|nr:chromate efflux transporter [Crocinitomicaceae bacterium]